MYLDIREKEEEEKRKKNICGISYMKVLDLLLGGLFVGEPSVELRQCLWCRGVFL